jgi:hypothetical protein
MPEPVEAKSGVGGPDCPRGDGFLARLPAPDGVDVRECVACKTAWLVVPDGGPMIDLRAFVARARLGDDRVRSAVSPDTKVEEVSIPIRLDTAWASIHRSWLELDGQVRVLMARLQNRAHFVHGELARFALAHPELGAALETSQQIIDLVAARPEGIPAPTGHGG